MYCTYFYTAYTPIVIAREAKSRPRLPRAAPDIFHSRRKVIVFANTIFRSGLSYDGSSLQFKFKAGDNKQKRNAPYSRRVSKVVFQIQVSHQRIYALSHSRIIAYTYLLYRDNDGLICNAELGVDRCGEHRATVRPEISLSNDAGESWTNTIGIKIDRGFVCLNQITPGDN